MNRENFILMPVGGLTLDPVTKTPIVILRDPDNKLNLPIWIGLLEATAMATELEGIKMARPMTHDLLRSLIGDAEFPNPIYSRAAFSPEHQQWLVWQKLTDERRCGRPDRDGRFI